MTWKKQALKNFRLYGVTDLKTADELFFHKVREAIRGGTDIIQLRSKTMADGELLDAAKKLRELTLETRTLFFINDRPDIALAVEADGVHIGQADFPVDALRKLCRRSGQALLIGKSTHSLEQARLAQSEGVDYIGVGPIYPTPTKPGRANVGLELIHQVKPVIQIPFVVIGGIDLTNIHHVLEAGATRIACVRALFQSEDTYEAARNFCREIENCGEPHV